MTVATAKVNPAFVSALRVRPVVWALGAVGLAGLVTVFAALARGRAAAAFLGSCAFLAGLSTATAACVFPVMLRASGDGALSLTAYSGGGDPEGLATALKWFAVGFPLAILYFVVVWRLHHGPVSASAEEEGGHA